MPWPQGLTLTKAPEELPPDVFVKRPRVALYDILKHKVVHLLPKGLAEEAEAIEVLKSQPHPNIVFVSSVIELASNSTHGWSLLTE